MKMKPILSLTIMSLLMGSGLATATPVANIPIQVSQPKNIIPNVAPFTIHPKGDEWSNWDETDDGYSVVRDEDTGVWYYAVKNARGKLERSNATVGRDDPKAFGLNKHQRPDRVQDSFPKLSPDTNGTGVSAIEQATVSPTLGNVPTVFILVSFQDLGPTYTPAAFATFLTSTLGAYYNEASYGRSRTVPASESHGTGNDGVIGWLSLPQNHPNTQGNTGSANQQLVVSAIQAADPYINYASYDVNNDGYVDATELAVVVIPAGYETAYGNVSCSGVPSVWGHKWSTDPYVASVDGKYVGLYHGGKGGYGMFGEIQGFGGRCPTSVPDHQATVGVMAHELGHLIYRWIDLYDTDPTIPSSGIGYFSLMSAGNWAFKSGDAYIGQTPVHPDAYHKLYSGWVDPIIDFQGSFSLPAAGSSSANSTNVMHMQTTSNAQQYFLFDNRSQYGYDRGLYSIGSSTNGILVLHVDESVATNADANHKRVDVEEADNNLCMDNNTCPGLPTHLFWSSNRTVFDDTTTPNSKLYDSTSTNIALNNVGAQQEIMTARFGPAVTYNLSATKSGNGTGSVISSPIGINCGATCSAAFPEASAVTLTATPDTGSAFAGWSGGCSGTGTCTVVMNSNQTVTATFNLLSYTVTPSAGTGGSISPNTPQQVTYGNTTAFTITTSSGYHIASVTGCNGTLSGNTYATGAITANCAVTASFAADATTATLSVTVNPANYGVISSNIKAINNCKSTCSATVPFGKSVSLLAKPAKKKTFDNWNGVCSGTNTSCSFVMDANKSATANFH